MFQMGGIGPMMGQANVFFRYLPEKIPSAIERYQRECRRLFEVLDRRLAGPRVPRRRLLDRRHRELVAGCTATSGRASRIDGLDHLARWLDAIGARPAVQRGKDIPEPTDFDEMIRKADQAVAKAQKMLV